MRLFFHRYLQSFKNQLCNFFSDQYIYQCGENWDDYNLEQQAYIVEHCFVKREAAVLDNCEEAYVATYIRGGLTFRTPECQTLVDNITAKNKEISKRIDEIKVAWLIEQGETVVTNADGTIKVGNEKGIANISLPASVLNSDTQLNQLKAQLSVLEQRRQAINCH